MSSTTQSPSTQSPSTLSKPRTADRVETLIQAIDIYEPHLIGRREDLFRLFARFVSRSVDARYLDRHPPSELLPDLEHLFHGITQRRRDEIRVRLVQPDPSSPRRGILIVCMPDMQFTYSTARLAIDHLDLRVYRTINTVVPIRRGEAGEIEAVGIAGAPGESIIWAEVESDDLAQRREAIESYIAGRLSTLQVCIADYQPMRGVLEQCAATMEREEDARMLRWMLDEHFVILGTKVVESTEANHQNGSLAEGIKRSRTTKSFGTGRFDDWRGMKVEDADTRKQSEALTVRKSGNESWVYRAGHMNHVIVQTSEGTCIVEGLFSFQGLAQPHTEIPHLDRKVTDLYGLLGAVRGSHLYRSARNAFNALPLEYLFGLSVDDIHALVIRIMSAENERRMSVHFTTEAPQHTALVFVVMPRTHYDDELRSHVKELLKERYGAASIDDGVYAGGGEAVTFHYFLSGAKALNEAEETQLRAEIEQLASPWAERLYDELSKRHDVSIARRLNEQYAEAFSPRYQEETSISRAATDIELLEALDDSSPFDCDIYREAVDVPAGITRLRLFESQTTLLSNILPVLDNFGLIVIDQFPTTITVPGRAERVVSTFRIKWADAPQGTGAESDLLQRRNRLRSAIKAVIRGATDNDQLNRLLLRADITWATTALIRTYAHYARQIGLAHGDIAIRDILLQHPDVTKALTELFRAKFDPDFEGLSPVVDDKRNEVLARARRSVDILLEGVSDLTSDQLLRTFANLIDATVRTNFYCRDEMREYHVVLKLMPEKIMRMPDPRPFREICVHHPLVAGLHLRFGAVARGGIRWSDRRNDYRT
ncbi:MAG: NAD-glutamate dehydrogenase, partial [Clostridia bacterium]|nr:NAD-glutamate dehydrogenase [Deltaproteobacteria bacterium]